MDELSRDKLGDRVARSTASIIVEGIVSKVCQLLSLLAF